MTAEARPEFYAKMDAANVDLKGFTEDFYHRLCFAKLKPVFDTLVYLKHETGVWLEVTTLIIPGENDGDDELQRAATSAVSGQIAGLEQVGGFGGKGEVLAEGLLYSGDAAHYRQELARVSALTPAD